MENESNYLDDIRRTLSNEVMADINRICACGISADHVDYGIPFLYALIPGFRNGSLTVFATGKNDLSRFLVYSMLCSITAGNTPAVMISLAQSGFSALTFCLSIQCHIPIGKINAGFLANTDLDLLEQERVAINERRNLNIVSIADEDIVLISSIIEDMVASCGVRIVFLDDVLGIQRPDGCVSDREAVASVLHELKSLALRYNVPIVTTAPISFFDKASRMDPGEPFRYPDAIIKLARRKNGVDERVHAAEYNARRMKAKIIKNRNGSCGCFSWIEDYQKVTLVDTARIESEPFFKGSENE